ncbi:hypothetical protein [Hydrogenovibrio kuenenii]|uniref:hypothetical protein n=1 Tax=Hydrogenovibrio kuenenii TaxID=63658 RepID=UPI000467A036|nr:hypothetical protein [Hydrogenovibrio kuenenii]
MKLHCAQLAGETDVLLSSSEQTEYLASLLNKLKSCITYQLAEMDKSKLEAEMVQDMSHISQAAVYAGNLTVDNIDWVKDNLFRCDYSYDWQIGWTCSGTQEEGRVNEKVRFSLEPDGSLKFKFLKLEF